MSEAELLEELQKIRELLEPETPAPPPEPKNFVEEFKMFLSKYKVVGLAVAFILALHLGLLVQSLVNDLIMPIVEFALPDISWEEMVLGPFRIGSFLGQLFTFIIVAFVVFWVVKLTKKYGID